MKVKELIKALKVFDGNMEVYVSADSEGNSYGTIEPDTIWKTNEVVIIYPCEDGLDYDELGEEQ